MGEIQEELRGGFRREEGRDPVRENCGRGLTRVRLEQRERVVRGPEKELWEREMRRDIDPVKVL